MASKSGTRGATALGPAPKNAVGVRELKNKLSENLRKVKAGQDLIITEHGKPVAKLSRLPGRPAWLQGMIDRGEITPGNGLAFHPSPVKLRADGPSTEEILREWRGRY